MISAQHWLMETECYKSDLKRLLKIQDIPYEEFENKVIEFSKQEFEGRPRSG